MKVIRIVQYEGTEEALIAAISQSLPLGVKLCKDYKITIAEHLNEIPPQLQLPSKRVSQLIKTTQLISLIEN